jgi:carotenoid cleavage dioxygenase-like enzyme
MDSGMIGKIEKAKRYAQERERFHFSSFDVTFQGDNNAHRVMFTDGAFKCDCEFFTTHQYCAHTMALESLLKGMLPETVQA